MKSTPQSLSGKPKRGYISLTPLQKDVIQAAYGRNLYPSPTEYEAIAQAAGMTHHAVRGAFKRLRKPYVPKPLPLLGPKPPSIKWSKYTVLDSSHLSRNDSGDRFDSSSSGNTSNDGFSEAASPSSPPSNVVFEQDRLAFLDSVVNTMSLIEIRHMQARLELTAAYLTDLEVGRLLQD